MFVGTLATLPVVVDYDFIATWSNRRSQQSCFVKKDALKNFGKFTGEFTCQSFFFNKVAGCRLQLYKKRLYWRCFLVKCAIFSRTYFLQNTSGRLLLKRNRILITRCITNFYPIQHYYHYCTSHKNQQF